MKLSRAVSAALRVINAAWRHGTSLDLASQAAFALEAAGLLQVPESEREDVEEVSALRACVELRDREIVRLRAQVTELERQVAAAPPRQRAEGSHNALVDARGPTHSGLDGLIANPSSEEHPHGDRHKQRRHLAHDRTASHETQQPLRAARAHQQQSKGQRRPQDRRGRQPNPMAGQTAATSDTAPVAGLPCLRLRNRGWCLARHLKVRRKHQVLIKADAGAARWGPGSARWTHRGPGVHPRPRT